MNATSRKLIPLLCLLSPAGMAATGPDVVVNEVTDATEFSDGTGDMVSLASGTDSCNLGTEALLWNAPPASSHPVISLNLYRLHDGRFEQLAQSWVKHGFFATNATSCERVPGAPPDCAAPPGHDGQSLHPGCTDLYPDGLNAQPDWLGARSKINPTTGKFDGATARDLDDLPQSEPNQRLMHLARADLAVDGARYYVEAHYIAADDAAARNARNNLTHAEVIPQVFGGLVFLELASIPGQVWKEPALVSWKDHGGAVSELRFEEIPNYDSFAMVGAQVKQLPSGSFRYEYAVYNMNSDRGIQAFTVEGSGIDGASLGSSAPKSYGEHWSNDPWTTSVSPGQVTWSTQPFSTSANANAIRWGTTYSFWLESSNAPVTGNVKLTPFKPAAAAGAPALDLMTLAVPVPGP